MRFKQYGVIAWTCIFTVDGKLNFPQSIIFYKTAVSSAQSIVHILSGETGFVLNKTATKHILPDNYGTIPGVELKTSSRGKIDYIHFGYSTNTILH